MMSKAQPFVTPYFQFATAPFNYLDSRKIPSTFAPSNRKSRVADIKEVGNISILTPMKEYRNIKYTYYDRRNGQGPYSSTHNGYTPSQSSYSSIEDMLQKTHPDYCRITVLDYDVVG